jgi:hypothetical protein
MARCFQGLSLFSVTYIHVLTSKFNYPLVSSCSKYWVCNQRNKSGATCLLCKYCFMTLYISIPHCNLQWFMGIKIYGAGTAYPSIAPELTPLVCSGLHVAQSEFSVFYRSLYCLCFFDLRLLIIPLISKNFSYTFVHSYWVHLFQFPKYAHIGGNW